MIYSQAYYSQFIAEFYSNNSYCVFLILIDLQEVELVIIFANMMEHSSSPGYLTNPGMKKKNSSSHTWVQPCGQTVVNFHLMGGRESSSYPSSSRADESSSRSRPLCGGMTQAVVDVYTLRASPLIPCSRRGLRYSLKC